MAAGPAVLDEMRTTPPDEPMSMAACTTAQKVKLLASGADDLRKGIAVLHKAVASGPHIVDEVEGTSKGKVYLSALTQIRMLCQAVKNTLEGVDGAGVREACAAYMDAESALAPVLRSFKTCQASAPLAMDAFANYWENRVSSSIGLGTA